jgi:DNA topoisomerase-1
MESATLDTVSAEFDAAGYLFRTSGYSVAFPGFLAVYEKAEEEKKNTEDPDEVKDIRLPALAEGQAMRADDAEMSQHFTEPPVRYNDASLVEMLEEQGVGRPSTYTAIITTILSRNYVKREGKAFVPTPLGEVTNRLMQEHFASIVDYRFTAEMEDSLDRIEEGEDSMKRVLDDFWRDFSVQLEKAQEKIGENSIEVPPEETDLICEKCGSRMIVRNGRFGKFAACPNYPNCRNTKPLTAPAEEKGGEAEDATEEQKKTPVVADFKCEKCGSEMVLRTGKFGSFYACSRYPECKFTKAKVKELGVPCPLCGAKLVTKYGRSRTAFYSCERYPDCTFSSWDMPTNENCPQCGKMLFRKKGKPLMVCHEEGCGYTVEITDRATGSEEKDNA